MSDEIYIDQNSEDCYIEPTIPVSFEVAARMLQAAHHEDVPWSDEYAAEQMYEALKRMSAIRREIRGPIYLDFSDIEWEDGEEDELQGA